MRYLRVLFGLQTGYLLVDGGGFAVFILVRITQGFVVKGIDCLLGVFIGGEGERVVVGQVVIHLLGIWVGVEGGYFVLQLLQLGGDGRLDFLEGGDLLLD